MPSNTPGEIELYSHFSQHLGPKFEAAGLRLQFHCNQPSGIHFQVATSAEYRAAITRGIHEGMAERFPEFLATGGVYVTEITDNKIDSCERAFYRVARSVVEQAFVLAVSMNYARG